MAGRPALTPSLGLIVASLLFGGTTRAQLLASAPIPISEPNLFSNCEWDIIGGSTPNSEVEAWIATNPINPKNIVVTWQQDRGSLAASRGLVVGATLDGGQSWKSVVVPGLSPCSGNEASISASDPWLSFSPNGDLHHIALIGTFRPPSPFLRSAIVVNQSVDGGLTWSDPITVHESRPPVDDKQSITADPTDQRFVYAVWNCPSEGLIAPCPNPGTRFARTTDGGQTWEPARVIADEGIGHQIVVLPDGTLVLAMNRYNFGDLAVKRSSDKGVTWLPPGDARSVLPIPTAAPLTPALEPVRSGFFDIAADPNDENLYVVWERWEPGIGGLPQVAFSMSVDGGLSWSEPSVIAQTPPSANPLLSQSFLPSVHVNDRGVVGVTYYDFRNDGPESTALTDYWFIHCDPANMDCTRATSWREVPVTASSFDFGEAPITLRGRFLGDYVGLTSAGPDFVTAFPQASSNDPASVFFSRIAMQIEIEIDIKPGTDNNSVNVSSNGVTPVAILGSSAFDVAQVDATTLAFGPAGAAPVHRRGGHPKDANSDGIMDLVSHYATRETGVALGDTEACVTGELFDGMRFRGCDELRTVSRRGPR